MFIRALPVFDATCVGCGGLFRTSDIRQKRCMSDCSRERTSASRNGKRAHARKELRENPVFKGIDGEGITLADDTHKYVLLSVGDASLHRDGEELSCAEIFAFLWEQFEADPTAVYCGYCLGYDFAQWFKTLPKDRAAMLFDPTPRKRTASGNNPVPFPVYWDDWEFDILGNKRFKLRKAGAKSWMYINDVGGFFQQSFVTAMEGWQDREGNPIAIVSEGDRRTIEAGKARRATAEFDLEMIRYNVAENRALSRMLEILNEGFKAMGVHLKKDQWYGPGQVAQKWMDQHSTHAAKILHATAEKNEVFKGAIDAARKAYFGGWFETMAHGHIKGTSYEYDIASAYPHVHSRLPCLLHGVWSHNATNFTARDYVLVRCDVRGDNPHIGAMLHRDKKGRINRPDWTSGWYWRHEIEAAQRAGLVCEVTTHETYAYTPCDCPPPMQDLREQYKYRLEVGKNTPHGRSLKLNYNSCYGKTAQSIGTPKHANSIHASMITAGCRTMILDAIATHPKGAAAVLMIATDGIYFDSPHPGLENQPAELGNWEGVRKENMTIFLPGVYWDDLSRANRGKKAAKLKSRGVNANDLIARLDALDTAFDRMLNEPMPWTIGEGYVDDDFWVKIKLPLRFNMVSPKQALQRGKWETAGAVTQNSERELWAHPRHKRELVFAPNEARPYVHSGRPLNRKKEQCTPYNRAFGMELETRRAEDYVLTPDGDAIDDAYQIMKG